TPSFVLVSFVAVAAGLFGFAPVRRRRLRLLGLVAVGTVFTGFCVYFIVGAVSYFRFISGPLPPNVFIIPGESARVVVLVVLITIAAIASWFACVRLVRKSVTHDPAV